MFKNNYRNIFKGMAQSDSLGSPKTYFWNALKRLHLLDLCVLPLSFSKKLIFLFVLALVYL